MGGVLAIETGARNSSVVAVIDDSGFDTLPDVIGFKFSQITRLPSWLDMGMMTVQSLDLNFNASEVRPLDDASKLHKPLLVIIGAKDQLVPPIEGNNIYNAASNPKELMVVLKAGHVDSYRSEEHT